MSAPATAPTKKDATPVFPVGPAGKRELRRALLRSQDPPATIQSFQQSHSLHTMMALAFGTTPIHQKSDTNENKSQEEDNGNDDDEDDNNVESLDTDSIMLFLHHLGVPNFQVHKRISDAIMKQLEDEIRQTTNQEPLLELLKSCWVYATSLPELRPVLWAVLRQLGSQTPLPVLTALAERDNESEDGKMKLKHDEIFQPLPSILKRLVWEADWDTYMGKLAETDVEPTVYIAKAKETLLYATAEEYLNEYLNNEQLVTAANRMFVPTARERKVMTVQRRTFTIANDTLAAVGTTPATSNTSALLRGTGVTAAGTNTATADTLTSGKAVSQLRSLLCDSAVGASTTASYRPRLLYAMLSILVAQHGDDKNTFLAGASHLRCTLVTDLLLATGGPVFKAFQGVVTLARILDECVQQGNITDEAIAKVQASLKTVFENDADGTLEASPKPVAKQEVSKPDGEVGMSNSLQRQLNLLITNGLTDMKEADAQSLFLNPVTDEIAPGYSKVISQPMCILDMEAKVDESEYKSLKEWEKDVQVMFQNCIKYNRGPAGQWFRGEANRQNKIFKDEILVKANQFFDAELSRRKVVEEDVTKKRVVDDENSINPLEPAVKKRKKSEKEKEGYLPSLSALAFMVLSDPFVVRIVIARILRELRKDVVGANTLPMVHSVVPSLLQLLHLAYYSTRVCAIRGKRYLVPDAGFTVQSSDDPVMFAPYITLRRYIPLLMRLILESEIDRRIILGGDLYEAAQAPDTSGPMSMTKKMWKTSEEVQVVVSILEGAIVHLCQPGNATDASLPVSFPKFSKSLLALSSEFVSHQVYFECLVTAILRRKTKLSKAGRDAIVEGWLEWLEKCKNRQVIMCSPAHVYLIRLLNDWCVYGNQVLLRDDMVKILCQSIDAVENKQDDKKVVTIWDDAGFARVKIEYERAFTNLAESQCNTVKAHIGLETTEVAPTEVSDEMQVDDSEPAEFTASPI